MARPLRIEYPGAFYHITSRGNERRAVFKSARDREKFLSYLGSATERYAAIVHVYCLMDNHYHLLLETPAGNLFQIWLQRGFILDYFGKDFSVSMKGYRDFVQAVMGESYDNPLAGLKHSVILGSSPFVAEIRDRYLKHAAQDRDLPALRRLLKKPSLDQIEQAVDAVLLSAPKLARQVKLHLCQRYSGMTLTEIGLRFGVGPSGVSQASQRIALKRSKDQELSKIVKRIEKNIFLLNV
jgi:hypothetical protein